MSALLVLTTLAAMAIQPAGQFPVQPEGQAPAGRGAPNAQGRGGGFAGRGSGPAIRRQLTGEGVPRPDEIEVLESEDRDLRARLDVVYWPGGEERARAALAVIEGSTELPGLDEDLPDNVELYLAPDREVWDALTGGQVPEWGAGVAIPSEGRIVIPLFDAPLGGPAGRDRTVLHEWAHLGLHQSLEDLRIPRWFDEGYAEWASGVWDRGEAWRLRFALAAGAAPPLDSLTLSWPGDAARADLAYLLSASAFELLFRPSGAEGVGILVDRWRQMGDFEQAFRATFAVTTGGFEFLWIEHIREQYGWVVVLYQSAVLWVVLGAGIVVLVGVRRGRDRERLAGLRAGEPPDRPAYWDGGEGVG